MVQCCSEHLQGEEILPVPNWSKLFNIGLTWEACSHQDKIVKSWLLCITTCAACAF